MKIVSQAVQAVQHKLKCPKCADGFMTSVTKAPNGILHQCTECNHFEVAAKQFPYVEFVPLDELEEASVKPKLRSNHGKRKRK